ncbi:unnamed protein product [Kluyveromyces dobzhanskii CBS 2104]|uniref:WGS project CCBQ000000000 data, contig 00106 n=1 Tax=Kluyveromyces dobzhanskii CBS 2104 TaxID=1427455 RepID=A0A0A8L5N9_9SACH|nr:unnamed protein product [Kluyveromyces dobzhanskii CBS 2104]
MDTRKTSGDSMSGLSNIPEIIDPGVTIPIYEEDFALSNGNNVDQLPIQPQKLGSYRSKAGKFSNTLSNLLPSISAKLHHNKKGSKGTSVAGEGGHSGEISSEDVTTNSSGQTSKSGSLAQINLSLPGHITPPQDVDYNQAIHLPDSSNLLVPSQSRISGDSFTFVSNGVSSQPNASNTISRTRNNTVSSQITCPSNSNGLIPNVGNVWLPNDIGNSGLPPSGMQPNSNPTNINNNINNNNTHLAPGTYSPYETTGNYFDLNNSKNNVNNLNVSGAAPAGTHQFQSQQIGQLWNNRPRSQSNASSIYTDAPMYDQIDTRSRASTFIIPPSMDPQLKATAASTNPVVQDDMDPRSINWVTTDPSVPSINHISNLLPTNTISISNVFSLQQQQPHLSNTVNLTSTSLATLCLKFGTVISARTLKGVNMAIVEFTSVEAAIKAKEALNDKEVSLVGAPSTVSFAKVLPMHQQLPQTQQTQHNNNQQSSGINPQSLLQEQLYSGAVQFQQQGNVSVPSFSGHTHNQSNSQSFVSPTNPSSSGNSEKEQCPFPLPPPSFKENTTVLNDIINKFGINYDIPQYQHIIANAIEYKGTSDTTDFGPLPEPLSTREFDAPRLRELRKSIDSGQMSDLEIEQLVLAMLDELPELSSDYLGNTIVQKLFEHASSVIKDIMLRKTSVYLTSMGVHKNGTWACQKMITNADTPRQKMYVANGVYKYCTPLFNDQFGNYVIQCVLKFGFPWNNFIFENIVSNFWNIVQNRYGARAVRACLEAHDIITQEQLLLLSAMIVFFVKYLATNSNGALLVTWFLDTCTLPRRHSILAEALLPNILELGCHKLASLTILKILNYRGDEVAKRMILDNIFGPMDNEISTKPPQLLYQLLNDTNYGPSFIYKVLSIPMLEGDVRHHVIEQVRYILTTESNITQHRRLLEEVGLNTACNSQLASQSKPRMSISHVFGNDHPQHMRNVSMNSARSVSSRPRASSNAQSQQQQQQQQQQPIQPSQIQPQLPQQPQSQVQASQAAVPGQATYYTYPGMFPGSQPYQYSTSTSGLNDDMVSNFDMLTFNNGTQISLPQLTMNGQPLPHSQNRHHTGQFGDGMFGH